ncbi:MAG: molecular chaperone DnaJ [Gammaproteobacteria bacterium]|nr:MAG: molecular chaperone DnaJ [Gammaproteobacteria bacterium]TND04499.1 MAG: molecular chaperone DnaJ [Gammaproteobacteria bacterium]
MDNQIFELVIKYFREPHLFPDLANVNCPLPDGVSAFLEMAVNEANTSPEGAPEIWSSSVTEERRSATVFFVKNVLLAQGGDYYRCLGLDRNATGDDIRRHFHALTGLLTIGASDDKSNWDENSAIRINEAYSVLRQPDKRRAYDANPSAPSAPAAKSVEYGLDSQTPKSRLEPTVPAPRNKPVGGSFLAKHLVEQNAKREPANGSLNVRSDMPQDTSSQERRPDVRPVTDARTDEKQAAVDSESEKPFQKFLDSHFNRAESALTEEELRRLEYLQVRNQENSTAERSGGGVEDHASEEVILPDLSDHAARINNEAASAKSARIGPLVIVSVSLAVLLAIVIYSKYSVLTGLPDRDSDQSLVKPGSEAIVDADAVDAVTKAAAETADQATPESGTAGSPPDHGQLLLDPAAGESAAASAGMAPDTAPGDDSTPTTDFAPPVPSSNPPGSIKAVEPPATTSGIVRPAVTTGSRAREQDKASIASRVTSIDVKTPRAGAAPPALTAPPSSPAKSQSSAQREAVDAPLEKKQSESSGRAEVNQMENTITSEPVTSSAAALTPPEERVQADTEVAPVTRADASVPQVRGNSARPVVDTGTSHAISQTDVDALLETFISTYRNGDVAGFLRLFSGDVRTNGRNDLGGIRQDYQNFFGETDVREFVLSDMHWNLMETSAAGQGKFNVEIRYKGDRDTKNVSGTITFLVESRPGGVVFTEMFHSYK